MGLLERKWGAAKGAARRSGHSPSSPCCRTCRRTPSSWRSSRSPSRPRPHTRAQLRRSCEQRLFEAWATTTTDALVENRELMTGGNNSRNQGLHPQDLDTATGVEIIDRRPRSSGHCGHGRSVSAPPDVRAPSEPFVRFLRDSRFRPRTAARASLGSAGVAGFCIWAKRVCTVGLTQRWRVP